jgi:hypothetical protein
MLVDRWELHRGTLRYLITEGGLNVEVQALTEDDSKGWSDLMSNEWLLVKDGDNSFVKETGRALIALIQGGDPFFHRLYKVARTWTLPSGDIVSLYHRGEGSPRPQDFPVVLIETSPIAEAVSQYSSDKSTVYFTDADVATWVGIHDLPTTATIVPEDAQAAVAVALDGVTGTILAVSRYRTAEVQDTLRATAYTALQVGNGEFMLTVAGRPDRPLVSVESLARWDPIEVTSLETWTSVKAGEVLPVDLRIGGTTDGSLKLSLRLQSPDGTMIAQQDVAVEPESRMGLMVPPQAKAGDYALAGVLYDPATLAPIPDVSGAESAVMADIRIDAQP